MRIWISSRITALVNANGTIATPDSADLAGLLNGYPRFFEVNRVVLDRQDSPIGPKSRILLR